MKFNTKHQILETVCRVHEFQIFTALILAGCWFSDSRQRDFTKEKFARLVIGLYLFVLIKSAHVLFFHCDLEMILQKWTKTRVSRLFAITSHKLVEKIAAKMARPLHFLIKLFYYFLRTVISCCSQGQLPLSTCHIILVTIVKEKDRSTNLRLTFLTSSRKAVLRRSATNHGAALP